MMLHRHFDDERHARPTGDRGADRPKDKAGGAASDAPAADEHTAKRGRPKKGDK